MAKGDESLLTAAGIYRLKKMKMVHRILILAMILLLAGCGGGGSNTGGRSNTNGGGNSDDSNGGNNPPPLQKAAISRVVARYYLESSLSFIDLTRGIMSDAPLLAFLIYNQEGEGDFNYELGCDNPDGTNTLSGNFSDGSGEIISSFQHCEDSVNELEADGVMRITVHLNDTTLIPTDYSVSFESLTYSSTTSTYQESTEGSIDVTPLTANTQVASIDFRITNLGTGAYIETDELKLYGDVPVGLGPSWEETRVAGNINYSTLGFVELSSGTSLMDYLKITGLNNSSILLRFLDEENFIATLDENGDGSWEAYLHDSLANLTADYGDNDAPSAVIDDALEVEPGDPIVISLFGVNDPDCDFLDYSINLIESPPGSEFDWSIDNNMNLIINLDLNGTYTFNLIIDDHKAGILVKQMQIYCLYGYPFVDLEQTSFQYTIEDMVEIDLSPDNLEEGPFTYEISPMLPGMEINNDGLFTWQVPALDYYFPLTTVEIEAVVSNDRSEVVIPLTFSIFDPGISHPIARTGFKLPNKERNIHVGDFDNDGRTEILLTDNLNLIYTLEWRNGEYIQDWVCPYEVNSPDNSIGAILPLDIYGTGRYEIFIQTGSEIKVLDIEDNKITASLDLGEYLETDVIEYDRGIAISDLDNNGSMEIVALFGTDYDNSGVAFILGAEQLNLLWQTPVLQLGKAVGIGNVDNDSNKEIVFSGGYVYDGGSYNNEWTYAEEFGVNMVVADVDGDGVDEIIANKRGHGPVAYSGVQHSISFEFIQESDTCSITAANLDNDPQKEILIGNCGYEGISAYDVDDGIPGEIWSVSPVLRGITCLAAGDSDQDGNLEVIWGEGVNDSDLDYLMVFDSENQSIDFKNTDPSQLNGPFIGGRSIKSVDDESNVVFAVALTDQGTAGSRLISMDFNTGEINISPEITSNAFGSFGFCTADYDLDGTEEVLLAGDNQTNKYASVYDLFRLTEEWSVTGEPGSAGELACADANGDGHTDLALKWGGNIRLYDLFNQTLLWDSFVPGNRIKMYDLDGDDVPEIISLYDYESKLRVYSQSGSTYVETSAYQDDDLYLDNLVVADIDGDQNPEIIYSKGEDQYSSEISQVMMLNSDLSLKNSFWIQGIVTAITESGNKDNTMLVATTSAGKLVKGIKSYVKLVDFQDGDILWKSPPLLGNVSRDSLQIVQKPGTSLKQLAIGAFDAMYLTQ